MIRKIILTLIALFIIGNFALPAHALRYQYSGSGTMEDGDGVERLITISVDISNLLRTRNYDSGDPIDSDEILQEDMSGHQCLISFFNFNLNVQDSGGYSSNGLSGYAQGEYLGGYAGAFDDIVLGGLDFGNQGRIQFSNGSGGYQQAIMPFADDFGILTAGLKMDGFLNGNFYPDISFQLYRGENPIPEPATLLLIATGMTGLSIIRRKRLPK